MNRSEYIANIEQARTSVPLWQLPARRVQANCKPVLYTRKANQWFGAIIMGLIMATPFIVEIAKSFLR